MFNRKDHGRIEAQSLAQWQEQQRRLHVAFTVPDMTFLRCVSRWTPTPEVVEAMKRMEQQTYSDEWAV